MNNLKIWSLVIVGSVATAACGDAKSSMNPVAPSAVVVDAQNLEAGEGGGESSATGKPKPPTNGNGNGKGGDNGKQPTTPAPGGNVTPPSNTTPPAPTTKKVQLEGLIAAKAASSVTVNGQVVNVPASAVIRHGSRQFQFSDLRVGDRVHVKATRIQASNSASPSASTLEATEVKLQNPGDRDDDEEDDPADPPARLLVSVTALDATASETGPDLGAFRFTRSGDATAALTVTFTLTGSATNGSDYQTVALSVTFGAGQTTATIVIVPLPDATVEGPETVILTVVDGAGYTAGSPATATVTIAG